MKKRKPVLLNGEALMADGKPLEFDAVNQEELDGKIDAPQTAAAGEVLTVEEVDEDGKPKKWKAAKISGTFVCTFNEGEDGWITCDKTVEEIITANNDGKDVIGHYYGEIYRLSTPLETGGGYGNPMFSNLGVGVLSIIQYDNGHFGINSIRLSDIAPEDAPDPYEVPVYVPTKDGMRWQYGRPLLATDYFMNELTDEEKALMQKNLDALPSPATAQVGQIVKVKAVDADGKVIETETIPHPVLYVTISKTGNTNTSDKTLAEIKSAYDSGCSVFAVVDSFVLPLLGILDNMACFCATTPDRELHRVSVLITESGVSLAYGSFVEGNQGVENAGKILGIGNDGNVVPEDKPVQALAGGAAPTTATAGVVGQEYYVIVNNAVTEMYVCTAVANGTYTWGKVSLGENGIKYVTQTLTDAQKKQARTNIGAGTSNFSGSYNDLTNKPNIPAATVIDTTLSKHGQAADAKAAGDAIRGKIDAPQVAQVGEVLTVEEIGDDGKPKKWKTAPGVNITTELTQESTDAQVPSAKAAYDAIQNATDKDAVRFVAQKLTDTQKQQARENIGAKPVDFPVTITSSTTDGVFTYTADKTFEEIKAAYESGANVCVNLYGNQLLFLSEISEDYVGFGGIITDYCTVVKINSENIITASDYYLYALNYFNDIIIDDNGNLFVQKDYSFATMTVPVPNLDVKDGAALKCMASGLEWVEDTSLPSPTTAQVGQIVKVKAVDADGKITETEAVDMPTQKTLKWITVHSSDLTETKRELIISTDTDGKSIADYNPVGLSLIVSTPADATVESNNGSPWVYPSATKADNAIRVIGSISGWKTIARDSAFVFNGGSSAMSCSGNVNTSLATYKLDGYALDGVRIFFNSANDHLPVGTHVEVAILCEVAE